MTRAGSAEDEKLSPLRKFPERCCGCNVPPGDEHGGNEEEERVEGRAELEPDDPREQTAADGQDDARLRGRICLLYLARNGDGDNGQERDVEDIQIVRVVERWRRALERGIERREATVEKRTTKGAR